MNFKGNIESLFNRRQNNEEDLAIIFKNYVEENGSIVYLPIGVASGKLDEENLSFASNNMTFNHLIKGPKKYGFAFSKALTETIRNNNRIPKIIQERLMLKSLRNFKYIYAKDKHKNPIIGVQSIDNSSNIDVLYEDELFNYYIKNFPTAKDVIELLKKASGKIYLDIKETTKILEENYTNVKQSKQILTSIWKHLHSNEAYNIFINGSDITPKKEIIKRICDISNIHCYCVSTIDNCEIFDAEIVLKALLAANNYNKEQAEHSILIMDNFDMLAANSLTAEAFAMAQYNIARILKGETILLEYSRSKKVYFDTSKLMIIGMGNFKQKESEFEDIVIRGFQSSKDKNKKEDNNVYKYGILEGLLNNFKSIIQMDEPKFEDYKLLLTERESAGILSNTEFFRNFNIELTFNKEAINRMASEAYKKRMTQADIRVYIENILSKASLQIAENPNLYKELIIFSDTITDNKAYKLVKIKGDKK